MNHQHSACLFELPFLVDPSTRPQEPTSRMATPGTSEGPPWPRRRTAQRVPTPSSSPEYRAISPPWNTQELAASATAPRSNRGASGTAEQAIAIDEDDDDEPAAPPARPANATPIRPANSNVNGQLQSALRSNKKAPGSAQSVRISENARHKSEDVVNDNGIEPEDVKLDSSPMSEPLPRRARIRHSLLPRDEDGKLSVRADVMEQRARVIVTVAQDAIQASLRKELEEVPDGEDILWIDLEKIWEALDCKQFPHFIKHSVKPPCVVFDQPTNYTSSTSNAPPCSCRHRL